MAEPHRRRASDNVDPDVLLAITEQASDNRHTLRNEMAEAMVTLRNDLSAIRQDVRVGNLAQVTESAQMKASLAELKRDVADLRTLEPRVVAVETYVTAAIATDAVRGESRTVRLQWPVWLLMAVNTVLVLLALILHH